MFELAFLTGLYSYLIFLIGVIGLLYKNVIILVSVLYFSVILIYFIYHKRKIRPDFHKIRLDRLSILLLILIFIQAMINLIGVLGPELSFDALWYHLTLPKIFLDNHRIFHIPGNLFYYSDLPKNIEMIFLVSLSIGNEIFAKFSHFIFGLLTLLTIFKIARKFLDFKYSLLSCVIFYSSLVVGWESITAYIDLGTTFLTAVSVYLFLEWLEKKQDKFLFQTAVICGFTIATKVTSLNLIPIYLVLILMVERLRKNKPSKIFVGMCLFAFISVITALPWFLFSYVNTGNPFYPLFDRIGIVNTFNFWGIINLFVFSQDPINPIYLISLPLVIYLFQKFDYKLKIMTLFFLLGLLFWYADAQIGGSRFVLPYLTILSIIVAYTISIVRYKMLRNWLLILVVFIFLISISYRTLANAKYVPVIIGKESKAVFLSNNLNFSFADFYDTDGYFSKHIKPTDKVLTYGFHNMYYVDFPFIDSSFIKRGDKFNYIAVQNGVLPKVFSNWKRIYYNNLTGVGLYSIGREEWVY